MPRAVPATIFVTLLVVVLALAAWQLAFVLLLAFAGLLLAVLFRRAALGLARHSSLPVGGALTIVILGMAALLTLAVVFVGPQIQAQLDLLWERLPMAVARIEQTLQERAWGRFLLERVPTDEEDRPDWNLFGALSGTVSVAVGIVANAVVLITVAIFLATDPGLYRRGILHLVPRDKRPRALEVLDAIGDALWWWLLGQGLAMAVVATVAGVGLWLIGIPLPLALGLIAGLLDFIPYVGPFLGAAPAVLVALAQSPTDAVYTVLLFLAIQQIEGNVLMPVIQKRTTALPPVLTILAVIGFGVIFGFLGVLVATPLLVVIIVLVRMVYVEDVLGDRDTAGSGPTDAEDPTSRPASS